MNTLGLGLRRDITPSDILNIWNALEDGDPDASTERLMAMTCDRVWAVFGQQIDAGDVAEALAKETP